jgi:predicted esterase
MDTDWKDLLKSEDPKHRAEAIRLLALTGNQETLEVLKDIYENDPDPRLQQYAQKAARHIFSTLQKEKPPALIISDPDEIETEMPESEQIQDEIPEIDGTIVSPAEIKKAEEKVQRAFSLHISGQRQKALRLFSQALEINPLLEYDKYAGNVASEITGLKTDQAFKTFKDQDGTKDLLETIEGEPQKKSRKIRPLSIVLLIFSLAILGFVSTRFISSGTLDRYRVLIARQLGGLNEHQAGGKSYHLIKPSGNPPTEGWPVVVAFHGYGGQGVDMLSIASLFTREGIAYLAPSFGGYEPYPGIGPIEPMVQILEHASNQIPIDQERVILLGFSQGGTFAYRFSVYHPEWVSGVVTAGAPDYDGIYPASKTLPYIFTWGALDGLQELVIPAAVNPLISQGYNVRYEVIPEAGHEVTPYAIDAAIGLVSP